MACIDPDGALSPQARAVLRALAEPKELEAVARETGLPLYRIRSSVRELVDAELVVGTDAGYQATAAALERLEGSEDTP